MYTFHVVWKVSCKFPDCVETFQNIWEISDCPDSSFIFQKVSALCGMFLYHLESVLSFRQV